MSRAFFNVASAVSAVAATALMPHQLSQPVPMLEQEIEVVELSIAEFAVTDSMVADLPFLDPADPDRINPAWRERMYALCDDRDERLGQNFHDWCDREETRACRLAESPRLPWHHPLRYPILEISKDGHVHIYSEQ